MKRHSLKRFTLAKHVRGRYLARRHFDWSALLEKESALWKSALGRSHEGPQILLATSMGGYLPGTLLDSVLAAALTLRGANVHVLLCDEILPACQLCDVYFYPNPKKFVRNGPRRGLCKYCFRPAYDTFKSLGVHVHRYSDFLTQEDIEKAERTAHRITADEVGGYTEGGIAVGEHALAGALRFYARGDLDGEPHAAPLLRRYLTGAILSSCVAQRFLGAHATECVSSHHGIYVPQGLVGEVCRAANVRVVNWHVAYRKKCFLFSHDNTYHHTMMTEPIDRWSNIQWTSRAEVRITDYLKSRWNGTRDWIRFHRKPEFDLTKISQSLGVDLSKPCIGMLTSVLWDAQLHYPSNAFPNMLDWVMKTIDYFAKRPDLQLIIRIHPAEIHGALPSRQKIVGEVRKVFEKLPPNVVLIPPESSVSTYAVMSQCETVIIYNTKAGVELACMGIPVIVAGEAWIRNKGFAIDVDNSSSYFEILDRLPQRKKMSEADIQKAKKYAYHFFFRRMIPLEFIEPGRKFYFDVSLSSLRELLPGRSPGLDVICRGILEGADFIYPSEEISDQ